MLRHVLATRYVAPLREGGSLPGLVEADDDGIYVVKFSGAGQGTAALVAEVVVGELARRVGVRVPELVVVGFDPAIGRREPDQEVQDLLRASAGPNLGVDFLPRAMGYDGIGWQPPPAEAAVLFWIDAFTANVDRTWRNPNLLVWHRQLWAIDHGAALVFQHAWPAAAAWAERRYDLGQHVLAPLLDGPAGEALDGVDARLARALDDAELRDVLGLVPDGWLLAMNSARDAPGLTAADWRARYLHYLAARRDGSRDWWRGHGTDGGGR